MSKNEVKVYKGLSNSAFTPEMLESNPTIVDKEAIKAIKAIGKAQEKTNASAYAIAFNLNELNKKRPGGAFVKRMNYKNIGEFAERFFNISSPTALAYAQTAEQLLTSDEYGIHSPYCTINEQGKVTGDFTVTQLMELRNTPVDIMTDLVDMGCFEFGNTTKAIRFKSGIVKAMTTKPKEGKASPYYLENATAKDIAEVIFSAVALLVENKDLTPIKALEMLKAPAETPAETPALDTSDGAIYSTIMNAIAPYIEYANENLDSAVIQSIIRQISAIGDVVQVQFEDMTID